MGNFRARFRRCGGLLLASCSTACQPGVTVLENLPASAASALESQLQQEHLEPSLHKLADGRYDLLLPTDEVAAGLVALRWLDAVILAPPGPCATHPPNLLPSPYAQERKALDDLACQLMHDARTFPGVRDLRLRLQKVRRRSMDEAPPPLTASAVVTVTQGHSVSALQEWLLHAVPGLSAEHLDLRVHRIPKRPDRAPSPPDHWVRLFGVWIHPRSVARAKRLLGAIFVLYAIAALALLGIWQWVRRQNETQ